MLQARRLGKELVVGIHTDEEILSNKGPTVMNLKERYDFFLPSGFCSPLRPAIQSCSGGRLPLVYQICAVCPICHFLTVDLSLWLLLRRPWG